MEWLKELFVEHSALQAVVVVSLISTIGIGLGKIRFFGISLGTAFIFFVGILAGHFGLSLDPAMLTYAEDFGLIIFVYALGLQVGPGFFSSMRADGLRLVSPAIAVVLAGTALAVALSYAFGIPMPDMSGILCGATTNTPALGAAQQTLQQAGLDANGAALSCAVTYPLGVVGVILAIVTLRKLFVRPADPTPSTRRTSSSPATTSRIPPSSARASTTSPPRATTTSSSRASGATGRSRFLRRTGSCNATTSFWSSPTATRPTPCGC